MLFWCYRNYGEIYLLPFVNVVYHSDWFVNIESSLCPWNKSKINPWKNGVSFFLYIIAFSLLIFCWGILHLYSPVNLALSFIFCGVLVWLNNEVIPPLGWTNILFIQNYMCYEFFFLRRLKITYTWLAQVHSLATQSGPHTKTCSVNITQEILLIFRISGFLPESRKWWVRIWIKTNPSGIPMYTGNTELEGMLV